MATAAEIAKRARESKKLSEAPKPAPDRPPETHPLKGVDQPFPLQNK